MRITAIIVTYSDRFYLLKQVLESCFEADVFDAIVVDNDSDKKSQNQLKVFTGNYKDKITVIRNSSNLGSAKAYKQGLKEAKSRDTCDYIWLLDDDNQPDIKALHRLKKYWSQKPKDVVALLSFRPDRKQYKQAILKSNPNLVLGWNNSFYGFHIGQKISNFFSKKVNNKNESLAGEIAYAPYGGMFFHKSILDMIGYPNEDYFLYSDDHDWSYRITRMNKKIHVVLNSIIHDIDTSWALKDKNSSTFDAIKNAPPLRIYYNVRNRIFFEKKYLIKNRLTYRFNRLIFTFILFCFCFRSENFKIFMKAVRHANKNILIKYR